MGYTKTNVCFNSEMLKFDVETGVLVGSGSLYGESELSRLTSLRGIFGFKQALLTPRHSLNAFSDVGTSGSWLSILLVVLYTVVVYLAVLVDEYLHLTYTHATPPPYQLAIIDFR